MSISTSPSDHETCKGHRSSTDSTLTSVFKVSIFLSHSHFCHCLTLALIGSPQTFPLGNLPIPIPFPGKKLNPIASVESNTIPQFLSVLAGHQFVWRQKMELGEKENWWNWYMGLLKLLHVTFLLSFPISLPLIFHYLPFPLHLFPHCPPVCSR